MSNSWEVVSPLPLPAPPPRTAHLFAGERPRHGSAERSDTQAPNPLDGCADYFAWKQLVDRTITAALLVVALPLMVLIAVAVLVFDGWPIMYRQRRVGQGGRIFWIWKFRTLCRNAEGETGAVWCTDGDPRVTALGRYLRSAHLDELPQFFNVLLGDMNLIGPRPERPTFVIALSHNCHTIAADWPYDPESPAWHNCGWATINRSPTFARRCRWTSSTSRPRISWPT